MKNEAWNMKGELKGKFSKKRTKIFRLHVVYRQVILYKKANIHCTVQCAGNGVHISKNMLEKTCSCIGWAGHSGDSHSRRETDGRESAWKGGQSGRVVQELDKQVERNAKDYRGMKFGINYVYYWQQGTPWLNLYVQINRQSCAVWSQNISHEFG